MRQKPREKQRAFPRRPKRRLLFHDLVVEASPLGPFLLQPLETRGGTVELEIEQRKTPVKFLDGTISFHEGQ